MKNEVCQVELHCTGGFTELIADLIDLNNDFRGPSNSGLNYSPFFIKEKLISIGNLKYLFMIA